MCLRRCGDWARGDEIGFYFVVEPGLKVAIEKDLECVDGPEEEKDPDAFPRKHEGLLGP
jgi:hypothetical protein